MLNGRGMRKAISLAITLTFAALALLSGALWHERQALLFNEQGKFFDASEGIVYEDGALVVYAGLALLFAALALAAALWTLRVWPR